MPESPALDGSNPELLGRWMVQNSGLGAYLLALASGWPDGLDRFKRYLVESGENLTADDFMIRLMEFAHTGVLPDGK